ncbi:MAG: MBL fold metallo-hydrolase [Phaeovulum sp.]|uniref:MBL fold metallo-hydrolase n=1 Tax=Phaeovulum sp. TaxID=2934796 RepID=UPI0027329EF4|nr:MBL fold metallo-hydrolase [Phaeovulum sp.]MDP3861024.1 MBL fold metallo-hydrolase [Phaeovulum sp.]
MSLLRFTILGCGSSGGVPRIGGHWGECDPSNPRNTRLRCSMLVERVGVHGTTRALIDTSPDMRAQLLATGVSTLDAVVYTHAHADHVNGLDDIRQLTFNAGARMPVWADGETQEALLGRFGYAFVQPADSSYPAICDLHTIRAAFEVTGAGGPIGFTPIPVRHGDIDALGFRVGPLAYVPDVSAIPEASWLLLAGLKLWVLDALRRKPHPTHVHLERALEWIDQAAPERAVLTNMHTDLDHDHVAAETPAHVTPAHDGMVLEFAL